VQNGTAKLPNGVRFDNTTDLAVKLKHSAQLLAEFNENGPSSNGCSLGGVWRMPTCYQICDEWCWAAVTTMAVGYYNGDDQTCEGVECQMPSMEFSGDCCPWTNSCTNSPQDRSSFCNNGGTPDQMADAAGRLTGGDFATYGALDQATLDSALMSGRPVMIAVYWQGGGGHALMVGGCDEGNGQYYLHDPWGWYSNWPGDWQSLSYNQLLQYFAPDGGIGQWGYSITWNLNDAKGQNHMDIIPVQSQVQLSV
jgi:hypothetical protein